MIKRAVSIVTYNRAQHLGEVIDAVQKYAPSGTDVFVCDDGSTDNTKQVMSMFPGVRYYYGPNQGVGANKNRALFLMKQYHYSIIIEDDLMPSSSGWFDIYERTAELTDIHHFCRVQDKEIPETHPSFTEYVQKAINVTPLYALSPRGDLTFLTKKVINVVGGLNPAFQGVGIAHGEWSERIVRAGLISHPLKWVDIKEARDLFIQIGDTVGGRWDEDKMKIKKQIKRNKKIAQKLAEKPYVFCPLKIT